MATTTSRTANAPPSAARAHSLSRALSRKTSSLPFRASSRPHTAQTLAPCPPAADDDGDDDDGEQAQHPPARAPRPADDWTAPDDKEGAIVRQTYAYFAQNPIRGDGKVAGEEMTRHKASALPWLEAGRANWAAASDSNIPTPVEGPRSASERVDSTPRPSTSMANDGAGQRGGPVGRAGSDSRAYHAHAAVAAIAATSLLEPPGKAPGPASTLRHAASTSSSHASRETAAEDASSYSSVAVPLPSRSPPRASRERRRPSPSPTHRCASPEAEDGEAEVRPVDRYGFFEADAEGKVTQGRALALPGRVFGKLPHRPRIEAIRSDGRLGANSPRHSLRSVALASQVPRDEESDSSARREAQLGLKRRDQIITSQHVRDQARTTKWQQMLTTSPASSKSGRPSADVEFKTDVSSGSLRRRVFKGVPDAWRPVVWPLLIRLKIRSNAVEQAEGKTHWTHYQHRHRRVASESASALGYPPRTKEEKELLRARTRASRYDVQIDLDVPRTMNGHWAFYTRYGKGQVQLFQVLHAMSLHCPDTCGYCQGMGPIAATLLLQLPSAAAAYTALVGLHDHYHLHDTFQPGFPGLQQLFFVHQRLVSAYIPSLAAALEEAEITPSSYATRWYITLFNATVPYATQLRIWDAFLLLGPDVLLLTGLALLWGVAQTLPLDEMGKKTRLLAPRPPRAKRGFETLLHALSSYFVVEDDDALMDWVARMLDRSHVQHRLAQAHEAWTELEARGETQGVVL